VTDIFSDESNARYRLNRTRKLIRASVHRLRPRRIGLRNRILLIFVIGALLLSSVLALVTYSFTRSNLVEQRVASETNQAITNARRTQNDLIRSSAEVLLSLDQGGTAHRMIYFDSKWTSSSPLFSPQMIPPALLQRVQRDQKAATMIVDSLKGQALVVGIPLPRINAMYFEYDNLREVRDALQSVRLALALAAFTTTFVGIALGVFASRRAVRPLANAAQAARAIADGRLETRLEPTDDPDMQALTSAFNDMVATLQERVERDARFTSDVSHELRSPLMTLAASVQVLESRRDDLPERSQAALDLLSSDVVRFQGLVEDLLEISRFDAGAIRLVLEPLSLFEFIKQAVSVSSLPRTEIRCDDIAALVAIQGDKRRLARVIANLIDNARIHSSGKPKIVIQLAEEEPPATNVWIVVEDDGDGLIEGEFSKIFERFSRGGAAGRRTGTEGAGLGLALAREHVTLHRGRIWAENRTDGIRGARFIVELPIDTSYINDESINDEHHL
jgi:signal transduction histidine kinase